MKIIWKNKNGKIERSINVDINRCLELNKEATESKEIFGILFNERNNLKVKKWDSFSEAAENLRTSIGNISTIINKDEDFINPVPIKDQNGRLWLLSRNEWALYVLDGYTFKYNGVEYTC